MTFSQTSPSDLVSLSAAVASSRGAAGAADWYSTGVSVCDRFSSPSVDALLEGRPVARVRRPCRAVAAPARFLVAAWSRMLAARVGLVDAARRAGRPVAILRTWVGPSSFDGGSFRDPCFGGLAGELARAGYGVVTVAGALGEHRAVYAAAAEAGLVPEHRFLRPADPLRAVLAALVRRPRARGPAPLGGRDVSADIEAAIREEYVRPQLFANRLAHLVGRRVAERYRPSLVVLTHEGYAWERQFVMGVRSVAPDAWVVGYQHAPVSDGVTSLVVSSGALEGLPDRVVAMGALTAARLTERGYPPQMVAAGPSLRTPRPTGDVAVARRHGPVLVALGEVGRSVGLVRIVREMAALRPGTGVLLRLHPLASRERFEALLGFDPEGAGLAVSEGRPLAEDLARCSALVYDASAVAFEAVAAGVPAVHVRLGDPRSPDPLEGLEALHASVARADDLANALDAFAALPDDVHEARTREARRFVEDYLGEVTAESMAAFVPPAKADR